MLRTWQMNFEVTTKKKKRKKKKEKRNPLIVISLKDFNFHLKIDRMRERL